MAEMQTARRDSEPNHSNWKGEGTGVANGEPFTRQEQSLWRSNQSRLCVLGSSLLAEESAISRPAPTETHTSLAVEI